MNHLKLVVLVAALTLPVSSTQALEWVKYDGTIPDNAVNAVGATDDRPICRDGRNFGQVVGPLGGQSCIGIRINNDNGVDYGLDFPHNVFITQAPRFQILVGDKAAKDSGVGVGEVGLCDTFRHALCGAPGDEGTPILVQLNGPCPSDAGSYVSEQHALYEWLKEALDVHQAWREGTKHVRASCGFYWSLGNVDGACVQ